MKLLFQSLLYMLYDLNSNIEIHKFELSIPEIKEDKKRFKF